MKIESKIRHHTRHLLKRRTLTAVAAQKWTGWHLSRPRMPGQPSVSILTKMKVCAPSSHCCQCVRLSVSSTGVRYLTSMRDFAPMASGLALRLVILPRQSTHMVHIMVYAPRWFPSLSYPDCLRAGLMFEPLVRKGFTGSADTGLVRSIGCVNNDLIDYHEMRRAFVIRNSFNLWVKFHMKSKANDFISDQCLRYFSKT